MAAHKSQLDKFKLARALIPIAFIAVIYATYRLLIWWGVAFSEGL